MSDICSETRKQVTTRLVLRRSNQKMERQSYFDHKISTLLRQLEAYRSYEHPSRGIIAMHSTEAPVSSKSSMTSMQTPPSSSRRSQKSSSTAQTIYDGDRLPSETEPDEIEGQYPETIQIRRGERSKFPRAEPLAKSKFLRSTKRRLSKLSRKISKLCARVAFMLADQLNKIGSRLFESSFSVREPSEADSGENVMEQENAGRQSWLAAQRKELDKRDNELSERARKLEIDRKTFENSSKFLPPALQRYLESEEFLKNSQSNVAWVADCKKNAYLLLNDERLGFIETWNQIQESLGEGQFGEVLYKLKRMVDMVVDYLPEVPSGSGEVAR
ncbi:hypothetical protein HII31_02400 [Pseudocercospora fuligena]|uniref:Uncharacterized protein n=1 Tax=Pseudocercospora fuligena TaxID=685502 RepID=A0A8H6VL14_9PEZI|nr:hypothetical protein HII31_02400 [Pseudocercospora fuligena]